MDWKGCRKEAYELTDANRRAWDFWYTRRMNPPDDPLFFWYSGIIARAMDEHSIDQAEHSSENVRNMAEAAAGALIVALKRR